MRDRQSEWSRNRTSDLKIGKNVKISKFDHIGACPCGREVSVPLFYHCAIFKAVICGQILPFSIQHKKCHFISRLVYFAGSVGRFYNKWQLLKTDHAAIIIELVQTTHNFAGRSYPKLSFNDIKEGVDREFIRKSIVTAKENIIDGWPPMKSLNS